MPKTLYALLVGVSDYAGGVSPLKGCVNDVEAFRGHLEATATGSGWALDVKSLHNAEATRANIVAALSDHLGWAGPDDTALFYFAGHGAEEEAPEEFWRIAPNRKNQTLVCYDSRTDGSWDLADKELAALIATVGSSGAHVVCIFDCCHSGHGTRNVEAARYPRIRRAERDQRSRPYGSYVTPDSLAAQPAAGGAATRNLVLPPQGPHVLLAACKADESALEFDIDGRVQGVFSTCLRNALQLTRGNASYRELMKRVESDVLSSVTGQLPQLECIENAELIDRIFLGGAVLRQASHFTLRADRRQGWLLDGGQVHGIVAEGADGGTVLSIFPAGIDTGQRPKSSEAVATARVTKALPGESHVEVVPEGQLSEDALYTAVVVSNPSVPLPIFFDGDDEVLSTLRQILEEQHGTANPIADAIGKADIRVAAVGTNYIIGWATAKSVLTVVDRGEPVEPERVARKLSDRIEHLARWERLRRLHNPDSYLNGLIGLELLTKSTVDMEEHDSITEFAYSRDGQPPAFKIKIINDSDLELNVALLVLSEDFRVSTCLLPAGVEQIPPCRCLLANNGREVVAKVPDHLLCDGRREFRDVIKLVVSTERFDSYASGEDRLVTSLRYRFDLVIGIGNKVVLVICLGMNLLDGSRLWLRRVDAGRMKRSWRSSRRQRGLV